MNIHTKLQCIVYIDEALTSRAEGVSPSRDQTGGAGAGTAGGQGHGSHVAVQGNRGLQLDQHDVIVQIVAVVAGVTDDL